MPPSASASTSRHRPSTTPYDRNSAATPSTSHSTPNRSVHPSKSKKRNASADASAPPAAAAQTLAATAAVTFASVPSGRTGSGGSAATTSSKGDVGSQRSDKKKQKKKKRKRSMAGLAGGDAEQGAADADMEGEQAEADTVKTARQTEPTASTEVEAPSDTLPFPITQPTPTTTASTTPAAMKTNRGISAKDVLDEVQKKRKHKHKHKEAGQDATASTSATVRRLEEAHQARDQLQKAQQEAEARRKEIQEKEAECILAQTKIAELEGRLQAQREANAIEVEAKDKEVQHGAETLERLRDSVACGVCMETLKDPHILTCGHIACKECLQTYFRTNNALSHRIEGHPEDLPPSLDISYRTKKCHVCRTDILRRPVRMYHMSHFFDILGLSPSFPSPSQVEEEAKAAQGVKRSSTPNARDSELSVADRARIDPWHNTFPPEQRTYTVYDSSDRVFRCPVCHGEVDDEGCPGCDIEFSVAGSDQWEREHDEESEDSDGEGEGDRSSGEGSERNDGGEGDGRAARRRVAFADARETMLDSEDEVERETTPGQAAEVSGELAVQEAQEAIARDRSRTDQRDFYQIMMSPTTQRMARERVEGRLQVAGQEQDDSAASDTETHISDDNREARRRVDRRSDSRNGSRNNSRRASPSRSRSTGRSRGGLGGLIDDEASDDEDSAEDDEEEEEERLEYRSPRRPSNRNDLREDRYSDPRSRSGSRSRLQSLDRQAAERENADRLEDLDFYSLRDRMSARRVGRSEHVGDEEDSEAEDEEEGVNDYDLDDGFIDDGEIDELDSEEDSQSESESEADERRRRRDRKKRDKKDRKEKRNGTKSRSRGRHDTDDSDDNEEYIKDDDNEDTDEPRQLDQEEMRRARMSRFDAGAGGGSAAGAGGGGTAKQGRRQVESSLEVEEPVPVRDTKNGGATDTDDSPVLLPKSRSSSQRSKRKHRVVDPDSDVEML